MIVKIFSIDHQNYEEMLTVNQKWSLQTNLLIVSLIMLV